MAMNKNILCSTHFLSIIICSITFFFTCAEAQSKNLFPCNHLQQKYFLLSEIRSSFIKRKIFLQADCKNDQLFFKLDQSHVLILDKFKDGSVSVEGIISYSHRPIVCPLQNDQGAFKIKIADRTLFLEPSEKSGLVNTADVFLVPVKSLRGKVYLEKNIPVSGQFGRQRKGERFHTAIDIPTPYEESILSPADGQVVMISNLKTQSTLFIRHLKKDKTIFYSAYSHVKDLAVSVGDLVNSQTMLARTFTREEFKKTHHVYNHVHFEVRKGLDDLGNGSIHANLHEKLSKIFVNPSLPLEGLWEW